MAKPFQFMDLKAGFNYLSSFKDSRSFGGGITFSRFSFDAFTYLFLICNPVVTLLTYIEG